MVAAIYKKTKKILKYTMPPKTKKDREETIFFRENYNVKLDEIEILKNTVKDLKRQLEEDKKSKKKQELYKFKSDEWWERALRNRKTSLSRRSTYQEYRGVEDPLEVVSWIKHGNTPHMRFVKAQAMYRAISFTLEFQENEDLARQIKECYIKYKTYLENNPTRGNIRYDKETRLAKDLLQKFLDNPPPAIDLDSNPLDIFGWYLPPRGRDLIVLRAYETEGDVCVDGADASYYNYYVKDIQTLVFNKFKDSECIGRQRFPKHYFEGIVEQDVLDEAFKILDTAVDKNGSMNGSFLFSSAIPNYVMNGGTISSNTQRYFDASTYRNDGLVYTNKVFKRMWEMLHANSSRDVRVKLMKWMCIADNPAKDNPMVAHKYQGLRH